MEMMFLFVSSDNVRKLIYKDRHLYGSRIKSVDST